MTIFFRCISLIVTTIFGLLLLPAFSFATPISPISDTLRSSEPSATSSHAVLFEVETAIPAGGSIVITPQAGSFSIPASMTYLDFDILVQSTSTDYTQRELSTTTSTSTDSVTFVSGTSGSFTFTLAASSSIATSSMVRIVIGTDAAYGTATSTEDVTNPSSLGSHGIEVVTYDDSSNELDRGKTLVFIIETVGVGPLDTTEDIPPLRTNGAPSGELPYESLNAEITLNTDELAVCRYSTTAGVLYSAMTDEFPSTGFLLHSGLIIPLTPENTYTFYVRCIDDEDNENIDDYVITFTTAPEPDPGGPGGGGTGPGEGSGEGGETPAPSGSGGGGGGGGGAPFPPTQGKVTLTGTAYPDATLSIVQDGTLLRDVALGTAGVFNELVDKLSPGVYTFGLYATDIDDVRSATYNSTFQVVGGTNNVVSNVYLPPTIQSDTDQVDPGGIITVSGFSVPGTTVHVWTHIQKTTVRESDITKLVANVDEAGRWSTVIDTTGFERDTHQVKAKTVVTELTESDFSDYVYYGVGVSPNPQTALSADLNVDGNVNLIDFSILLFHWNTPGAGTDPPADINQDGTVNLIDFSIMLFQWTG